MFVTDDMIGEMVAAYGRPIPRKFSYDVTPREFDRIRASQKHDRNHDVTLYVGKEDRLIVIAKHFYPPGLYRAPSGGIQPGESWRDGIDREVSEEIGCEIELDRFLLSTEVTFTGHNKEIFWRSFVFLATYVSGDFNYTDHDEIKEVRQAHPSEFEQFGQIMRSSDIGGLHYRADLHDSVVWARDELRIKTDW